jgi:integrase
MGGRSFYLFTRQGGMIYAEIHDPQTGALVATRSTRTRNRDEAVLKAGEWLREGIPVGDGKRTRSFGAVTVTADILKAVEEAADLDADGALRIAEALMRRGLISFPVVKPDRGRVDFSRFLSEFWDYEKSPYVREKLAHGYRIGRKHCYEGRNRIRMYWEPYFQGRTLDSITREDLKAFSLYLAAPKEVPAKREEGRGGVKRARLSPGSMRNIILAGTIPLTWACREKMIAGNPGEGLLRFNGETKKRGVLAPDEARAVFSAEWSEKRALAGNLLAATTGLRSGEILALRKNDIDPVKPVLFVRHSWSPQDGLKSPKNGEERRVPLLPEVRGLLLELLAENPFNNDPDPFIFYSTLPDQPMDGKLLIDGLREAIDKAGAEGTAANPGAKPIDWKGRNIVFHSWRHFFTARMADKMTAEEVMRIAGHKTRAVFDIYQDHLTEENLEAMGRAGAEVFGKILQFTRKGA